MELSEERKDRIRREEEQRYAARVYREKVRRQIREEAERPVRVQRSWFDFDTIRPILIIIVIALTGMAVYSFVNSK